MPETRIEILHFAGRLRANFTGKLPEERHFPSAFSAAGDCALLRSAVLVSIAARSASGRTPQSAGNG
jgi:hypothetical protein